MKYRLGFSTAIAIMFVVSVFGCSRTEQDGSNLPTPTDSEESTLQLTLTDTYDNIRNGAHLILSYDEASNSFKGTVKNTTDTVLLQVRVEVHLSNGQELGPTTPTDLNPGQQIPVVLVAQGTPFDKWTAHPEVGPMTSGGEGEGEHAAGAEGGNN